MMGLMSEGLWSHFRPFTAIDWLHSNYLTNLLFIFCSPSPVKKVKTPKGKTPKEEKLKTPKKEKVETPKEKTAKEEEAETPIEKKLKTPVLCLKKIK